MDIFDCNAHWNGVDFDGVVLPVWHFLRRMGAERPVRKYECYLL